MIFRHDFQTRVTLTKKFGQPGTRAGAWSWCMPTMSRVGRLLNGPDALIGAASRRGRVKRQIVAYADWNGAYDELLDEKGRRRRFSLRSRSKAGNRDDNPRQAVALEPGSEISQLQ
ncbi:hypothetical protein N181_18520 [Sinorhizobium fredii USDA 205]|nr:hypothetical protein N181_18520 [Sinorhizobium fredii USDA 205]GEC32446.1 hypothetical protein EFR01_26170 [Sinorhizobium fredii]GLS08656.1 hypothetical protein GCM10007864_22850 [Sinorhizobium fredii]